MRVGIRLRYVPSMMPVMLRLMFRPGVGHRCLLRLRAWRGLHMSGRQRALAFAETEGLRSLGGRADRERQGGNRQAN
jgi:hypothetical protein